MIDLNKLQLEILDHQNRYHNLDKPKITDAEYDQLVQLYIQNGGNSQDVLKVGAKPTSRFAKVKHYQPMLSLSNTFNEEETAAKLKEIAEDVKWALDLKLDGLALELTYEGGNLVRAATRGDGVTGEDVTQNALRIKGIPHQISSKELHVIRGEVLMLREDFDRLNAEAAGLGRAKFATMRNAAAGTLRQLDPEVVTQRGLTFIAYSLIQPNKHAYLTDDVFYLEQLGFKTAWFGLVSRIESIMEQYYKHAEPVYRKSLPYDIDGLVLKVNDKRRHAELGSTSHSPKWAFAFKFPPDIAVTVLEDIEWQVGRTGVLTPVAKVRPVVVGGVTVSSVTLHNAQEISRLAGEAEVLFHGDIVSLHRSGDVIPKITAVTTSSGSNAFETPEYCPCCSTKLVPKDKAFIACPNTKRCEDQIVGRLSHAVSREALNIDGLGESTIRLIRGAGFYLSDIYSIFILTDKAQFLESIDGLGEVSVRNLVNSIHSARADIKLSKFIYALGIEGVGATTARTISAATNSIKSFLELTINDLVELKDIGTRTAINVVHYINDPENRTWLENIEEIVNITPDSTSNLLRGQLWVVTGSFEEMSREQLTTLLTNYGASVSNSISKKTTHLLAGANAGSKLSKAKELGVTIVTFEYLKKLIN